MCPVCPRDTSHLSRDMSRLSWGHITPFSIDLHIKIRPKYVPGVPGTSRVCPWDASGASDRQIPLCDFFSGLQKGPAERGHVKKRQKSSKSVKKFFDTFRKFSRRAKNVKNRQKLSKSFSTLFDNFRAAPFSGPFCNPLIFLYRFFLSIENGMSPLLILETLSWDVRPGDSEDLR